MLFFNCLYKIPPELSVINTQILYPETFDSRVVNRKHPNALLQTFNSSGCQPLILKNFTPEPLIPGLSIVDTQILYSEPLIPGLSIVDTQMLYSEPLIL